MRKGGMLEMGAGPGCKRLFIPLQNIVREFSQNWEHILSGGRISMLTRDQDETYGEALNPVEFQLKIKEFSEDRDEEDQNDYTIDLRLGRIEDEDDESVLGGELGACVARFNVNDLFTVWVDRTGNYQCKIVGQSTIECHSLQERIHHANLSEVVEGLLDGEYQQRNIVVHGNDTKRVERDKGLTVLGKYSETITGSVTRNTGPLEEYIKGVQRTVAGQLSEDVTGSVKQNIGDTRNISVMGDSAEITGGAKSTTVGNASNPNPLGKGYQIHVYNGVFAVHDVLGKIVFSSGTPLDDTALAKIKLKPTGAVQITTNPAGTVKFEINNTGIKLATPAGQISIDNAGIINMGTPLPPYGAVLTTMSYPANPITGTPTQGVSTVRAGGLPVLAPADIAAFPLKNSFVPDLTP
jgi:hypothetical protein